jgi:hypothetical protein
MSMPELLDLLDDLDEFESDATNKRPTSGGIFFPSQPGFAKWKLPAPQMPKRQPEENVTIVPIVPEREQPIRMPDRSSSADSTSEVSARESPGGRPVETKEEEEDLYDLDDPDLYTTSTSYMAPEFAALIKQLQGKEKKEVYLLFVKLNDVRVIT